ncbi:hypothetical protein MTO96_022033 [Rhipicephalus appendiculatus]
MVYEVRPEDEILGFAAVIREGTDEPLEIYGYSYSPWRCGLYRVLCALTLGLLPLVTSWKPEWYVQMSCTPCQLSRATVLVVKVDPPSAYNSTAFLAPYYRLAVDGALLARSAAERQPQGEALGDALDE